ncbi:hypothetical protein PMKS-002799 [Pichia membranifaciens]|uniref:Protein kinase domain-containing protein n=1 Tax=Pichia membranifaciens TaxID=4926 RepID=A0A1Q2YIE8_9ASCO|nr:hypothetical protein PMKS-002799 [Pichia membranifaciens]
MLDLFKNIISRKTKEPKDLKDLKNIKSQNGDSTSLDSSPPAPPPTETQQEESHHSPESINVLLEIHPELADYYSELHTRYLLSDKIGEGAFSYVYKAYDSKDCRYLAIKIIDKSNMKPDQISSTLKEVAIMRHLNHPNIVKLYSYQNSSDSKYCFLFLEYVAGGEIFNQIIKYTYFSENLTRHIIRQVAFAVKYLHDNGVVHRDIKPENLLFEPSTFIPRSKEDQLKARRKSDDDNKVDEGQFTIQNGAAGIGIVKLADFGLSTLLQTSNSLAKTPCGTVGYTSPEQHMNIGYDKKVDMWAIGCVLYTMVVGFPPFYSNTQDSNDITEKVMKGDYQFLKPWFDEVSDGCTNLISNLLTVDPAKRYSIEELLSDPWINIGYESEKRVDLTRLSSPADDAPKSTYDNELYKAFSEDLINNSNVDDYFAGHKITSDEGQIMTPRAEAIKLVFDTAKDVQKTVIPSTGSSRNADVVDTMCLSKPTRYISNTESISDLDTESDDDSSYNDSQAENLRCHRFSAPINIKSDFTGHRTEDDENDSLDSEEIDEDTDDYPITLTSLTKIKSPMMVRRANAIESSTSSCLSPVHSHGTTLTLTTQASTRAPSIKSLKSAKSFKSFKSTQSGTEKGKGHDKNAKSGTEIEADSNNVLHTRNGRKTSISFNVNPSIRSGSLTSNSSHLSDLSNSSATSATSGSSGHLSKIGYATHLNEVNEVADGDDSDVGLSENEDEEYGEEDYNEDDDDDETNVDIDSHNETENEWEDKTPLAGYGAGAAHYLHKLSHSEFRSKCQAHTPYVFKCKKNYETEDGYAGEAESPEDAPQASPPSDHLDNRSLEQKMLEHGVVNLQLNSSTILSRRKLKTEQIE